MQNSDEVGYKNYYIATITLSDWFVFTDKNLEKRVRENDSRSQFEQDEHQQRIGPFDS